MTMIQRRTKSKTKSRKTRRENAHLAASACVMNDAYRKKLVRQKKWANEQILTAQKRNRGKRVKWRREANRCKALFVKCFTKKRRCSHTLQQRVRTVKSLLRKG